MIERPRAGQITAYLTLFGSHERSIPLWEATANEPAVVFWQVFLNNWCDCDGLWTIRRVMLSTLRLRAVALSPIDYMTSADRSFYESLPDPTIVFRGCGRRRVRGLPWTTDRKIAEFFARGGRFPAAPDPVIACAEIAKTDIFFVSAARKESEVILDPYAIKRLRIEPYRP